MTPHNIPMTPKFRPPLDPDFTPAALFNLAYRTELERSGQNRTLVIGVERADGIRSRYQTAVFSHDHPWAAYNNFYIERIVKFLLWQRGGYKVLIGGPPEIGQHIQRVYAPGGTRAFDYHFMGEQVYERTFEVIACTQQQHLACIFPLVHRRAIVAGPTVARALDATYRSQPGADDERARIDCLDARMRHLKQGRQ